MADKSTKHKCDYCDRFLASAQSLKNHQVLHTGQDKYRLYPRIKLHRVIFLGSEMSTRICIPIWTSLVFFLHIWNIYLQLYENFCIGVKYARKDFKSHRVFENTCSRTEESNLLREKLKLCTLKHLNLIH